MANRSFLNPKNEYEDEEQRPYSSVSSRSPLEDVTAPDPAVKSFISQRMGAQAPSSLDQDPLMQQYAKEQADLDNYRKTKIEADNITNMGAAFSQLAQGVNTPKDTGVFKQIAEQNQELLGSKEKDMDRRRKVMDAIEARKAREAMESGRREDRNVQLTAQREDRKLQRDQMQMNRDLAREDRKDKDAKLSEKQLGEVQDFDDSIASMKSVLGQLGNHDDWTGPLDGRVPDMLASADQVAFRSELGRMVDKYRKLITGAGASNQELKKLEGRLPQPTDTYANFIAKAKNFVDTVERSKGSMLKNLSAQGKNTKPFEGMAPQDERAKSTKIVVSNGKETLQIDPSDLADAEKDGYKRI